MENNCPCNNCPTESSCSEMQCAIKEPGEIKGPSSQTLCFPVWWVLNLSSKGEDFSGVQFQRGIILLGLSCRPCCRSAYVMRYDWGITSHVTDISPMCLNWTHRVPQWWAWIGTNASFSHTILFLLHKWYEPECFIFPSCLFLKIK